MANRPFRSRRGATNRENEPMHYLTLLYDDETNDAEPGTPEFDLMMEGYAAFDELAGPSIRGGEALLPTSTARTVRHDGDQVRITAGPFAEATEVLGGFFVLEADSLDEAIEIARAIPAATTGGIELRPMVEWTDRSGSAQGGQRWVCTIHGPAAAADDPTSDKWNDGAAEHGRFAELAGAAVFSAGAVRPASSATTIRVRDGELLVSDGPFAEGSEVVGGFYVLAGDEDAVVALAEKIPVSPGGAVEIRPAMETEG